MVDDGTHFFCQLAQLVQHRYELLACFHGHSRNPLARGKLARSNKFDGTDVRRVCSRADLLQSLSSKDRCQSADKGRVWGKELTAAPTPRCGALMARSKAEPKFSLSMSCKYASTRGRNASRQANESDAIARGSIVREDSPSMISDRWKNERPLRTRFGTSSASRADSSASDWAL